MVSEGNTIMATMNQGIKEQLLPGITAALNAHHMTGTVSVHNKTTIVVTLRSGQLPIAQYLIDKAVARLTAHNHPIPDDITTIPWRLDEYSLRDITDPNITAFLTDLIAAMKGPEWHKESNPQADFFSISHFLEIKVGTLTHPYTHTP